MQVAKRIVATYLDGLAESGQIGQNALTDEVSAIFALVQNESALYAHNKPLRVKERVAKVIRAFDATIASKDLRRFIDLWSYWSDLVNPASPKWIGIDLPGSMVIGGFMILEDFLDLKRFLEDAAKAKRS